MVRIILADDHRVVRNGIKLLLETQTEFEIVGEATNGREVLDVLEGGVSAELIITDMNMNGMGGLELMQFINTAHVGVKVVFLSMVEQEQEVKKAFDAGACAYLLKNADYDELLFALNHVLKGGRYISAEISYRLLNLVGGSTAKVNPEDLLQQMEVSSREFDVLQLLVHGNTTKDIADKLFISKRTVEGHRQKLLDKTGSKNYAELIRFAIQNQLID